MAEEKHGMKAGAPAAAGSSTTGEFTAPKCAGRPSRKLRQDADEVRGPRTLPVLKQSDRPIPEDYKGLVDAQRRGLQAVRRRIEQRRKRSA